MTDVEATGPEPDGGTGGAIRWVRDVVGEVAALPDTLRSFREGVVQFREVTSRLATATETIDRVNAHGESTGLYDALRRLDDTARALEREAVSARDRLPGRELLMTAARDVQTVLGALGGLVTSPARAGRVPTREAATPTAPDTAGDDARPDGDQTRS